MRVHCIQHVPFEGPGFIAEWFSARGTGMKYWKLYERNAFPDPGDVDFLLVMGGPMNIYEYNQHPYLKPEMEFLSSCLRKHRKVLGICLGAQLIADVLGERIYPNPVKEIGWYPVRGDGKRIPENFTPFHWHGDTFRLPPGAVHLASSKTCRNQAFSFGSHVLALQFHLEADHQLIGGLLENVSGELDNSEGVQSAEEIRGGLVHASANKKILFSLLEEFINRQ